MQARSFGWIIFHAQAPVFSSELFMLSFSLSNVSFFLLHTSKAATRLLAVLSLSPHVIFTACYLYC